VLIGVELLETLKAREERCHSRARSTGCRAWRHDTPGNHRRAKHCPWDNFVWNCGTHPCLRYCIFL
jgi:hypothetical protein